MGFSGSILGKKSVVCSKKHTKNTCVTHFKHAICANCTRKFVNHCVFDRFDEVVNITTCNFSEMLLK